MKAEEPDLSLSYTFGDYLTWDSHEMVGSIRGKVYRMSSSLKY